MRNCDKFHVEAFGEITSAKQLKELQADIHRLPNFGGRGICCDNVTNRDFWAVLRDKKTGEIWSYFGSRDSFNAWGQMVAITSSDASAHIIASTCWCCGANPKNDSAVTLKLVQKSGDIKVWECEKCYGSLDTSSEGQNKPDRLILH